MISQWPAASDSINYITVHSVSSILEGINKELTSIGASSFASAVWPTANTAFFIPTFVAEQVLVTQLFSQNGSAVSGNIDVGIYTMDGTRIVSSGSTAHASGNANQLFNITDTLLGPGVFYLALALDNVTGAITRYLMPTSVPSGVLGVCEMATAFPLPAMATLVTTATNYVPGFGYTTRSVF